MPGPPEILGPIETDLTNEEIHPFKNNTLEELKIKLENKDKEIETDNDVMIPEGQKNTNQPLINEDGLIIPRKPANPIKDNIERQILHKELLFNQKIGKSVLNQKSELQKALEKQKVNLAKKEYENHIAAQTPELEKVIADRAKRLQKDDKNDDDDKVISKEFLEARMRLKNRNECK